MTPEQTAFELRQARAADYLREQHQRRLAEAVRQSDAPASRGWFVLLAALVAVALLVGLTADPADASPPPPQPAPTLSWSRATVERGAERWLRETNADVWGDGVRLADVDATCARTGKRWRCEVASLWSIASGDEYGEQRDTLTRCTPDRRVRRNAASRRAARVVVKRAGRYAGGMRCSKDTR